MKQKLTAKAIDDAPITGNRYTIWDTEQIGFGLRVTENGAKSFVFKYATEKGTQRWYTIGKFGKVTPKIARDKAKVLRGQIVSGLDPQKTKSESRGAITVAELCEKYLKEGCSTKKPSTLKTDKGRIKRHIIPLLGKKFATDVTSADIARFRDAIAKGVTAVDEKTGYRGRARVTGGKGTATRTMGLLSGIFSFAVKEDLCDINPVTGVEKFADRKRERFLTSAELSRLNSALGKAESSGANLYGISAIRILALTGCRKSEILSLRWADVDFENSYLSLKDSKTGQRNILVGDQPMKILDKLPRIQGNPFVFPSLNTGKNFVGLQKIWQNVRKEADMNDVRLHDLRHTFASVGASEQIGLTAVGAILGHSDPKTTSRYSHFEDSSVKQAVNTISEKIFRSMSS